MSENLASVGFDEARHILEIEFRNGRVYQYSRAPRSVFTGLIAAASKGTYFTLHIRDQYPYRRIR